MTWYTLILLCLSIVVSIHTWAYVTITETCSPIDTWVPAIMITLTIWSFSWNV